MFTQLRIGRRWRAHFDDVSIPHIRITTVTVGCCTNVAAIKMWAPAPTNSMKKRRRVSRRRSRITRYSLTLELLANTQLQGAAEEVGVRVVVIVLAARERRVLVE